MADDKKDAKAPDAKKEKEAPQPIPVRALQTGFYAGGRVRKGTLFFIQDVKELGSWMERRDTPEARALDEAEAAREKDEAKFAK